jgi:predicted protein tyrosine phosphatase
MKEVLKNLYIGEEIDCSFSDINDFAIIHACKHPCHAKAVGYKGNLPPSHPNYLILEKGNHLFLNMVDMERELLPKYTNPIMKAAISFIDKCIHDNKILIHCNLGQSRSPSISLVYLALKGYIANDSFQVARKEFEKMYSNFYPANGIYAYLKKNWVDLMKII